MLRYLRLPPHPPLVQVQLGPCRKRAPRHKLPTMIGSQRPKVHAHVRPLVTSSPQTILLFLSSAILARPQSQPRGAGGSPKWQQNAISPFASDFTCGLQRFMQGVFHSSHRPGSAVCDGTSTWTLLRFPLLSLKHRHSFRARFIRDAVHSFPYFHTPPAQSGFKNEAERTYGATLPYCSPTLRGLGNPGKSQPPSVCLPPNDKRIPILPFRVFSTGWRSELAGASCVCSTEQAVYRPILSYDSYEVVLPHLFFFVNTVPRRCRVTLFPTDSQQDTDSQRCIKTWMSSPGSRLQRS
jgi:hypothetical protein